MAVDTKDVRIQLSIKSGERPMLNIYARDIAEFEELIESGKANQDLAHFFNVSDTQAAGAVVKAHFPDSQADGERPNCPECNGPTAEGKKITTKFGDRMVYECLQQNGTCKNQKGYANAAFVNVGKGRDG